MIQKASADSTKQEWSNFNLPKQENSWVAFASHCCRNTLTTVPLNATLSFNGAPEIVDATYRIPHDPQTALVFDAFLANACVTVLHKSSDLPKLIKAETAELEASKGLAPFDECAALPRAVAITILIRDSSKCTIRKSILDCVSYLARCGGMARAIRDTRMAILTDGDASSYALAHGRKMKYGIEMGLIFCNNGPCEGGRIDAEFIELPYADKNKKMYKVITKAIAKLFETVQTVHLCEQVVAPASLLRTSSVSSHLIDGAYVNSMQEANNEFWAKISVNAPFEPIECKLSCPPSSVHWKRIFLKLAPWSKTNQVPLNHESVSFGILLYKKSMDEEATDFVVSATNAERNSDEWRDPNAPFGLRAPVTSAEKAINLHVLTVGGCMASLEGEISAFGLIATPGNTVCNYPNASLPRLVYALRPFDERFVMDKFVLPCTQTQTDSVDERFVWSQWKAAEWGADKFKSAFQEIETTTLPGSVFNLTHNYTPPSKEDEIVSQMAGIPIGGAFRLGDVYENVSKKDGFMPSYVAFLLSSISRLGPNASMSDAMRDFVDLNTRHEQVVKQLELRVKLLEQSVPIVAAPVRIEHPSSSFTAATKMISCMGMKRSNGVVLKSPIVKGRVTAVVRAISRATKNHGGEKDEDSNWGKANCASFSTIEAIAQIARNLNPTCKIYIITFNENLFVDFLSVLPDGTTEKTSPMCALEASSEEGSIFLQYDIAAQKLFPLIVPT
tara:strand:+ start:2453 stop:4642 length:2190 start_codon:yes stop_codon:yes gene_type:complete